MEICHILYSNIIYLQNFVNFNTHLFSNNIIIPNAASHRKQLNLQFQRKAQTGSMVKEIFIN